MNFTKTLMLGAAVTILSAGSVSAAEGSANTDGTHNANNTQTDTNMGVNTNRSMSNDAASDVNTNASTEAEMTDTSNDMNNRSNISSDHTAKSSGMGDESGANMSATSSMDVRSVQSALRDAGHSLSVDGIMGPKTKAALREFQQQNGLDATGMLNAETVSALQSR